MLRFSINNVSFSQQFVTNIGCWTVAIFGCLSSEGTTALAEKSTTLDIITILAFLMSLAEELDPTPPAAPDCVVSQQVTSSIFVSMSTSSTSSSPTPSMGPSGGGAEPSSLEETKVEKDYMVVAIVLPIAILTILIVAAIVAVGVLLCVRNSKRTWKPK